MEREKATRRRARRRVALALELEWPYRRHVDVYLGVQRYAQEKGHWDCIIDEYPDLAARAVAGPAEYDGIIARVTPDLAYQARRHGVPLVNVWHNSPASDVPAAFPDFYKAGQMAADHLLDRSLGRFACTLFPRNQTHQALCKGFSERLYAAGHRPTLHVVDADRATRTPLAWQRFRATLAGWVASWQPPVGVFVTFGGYNARHLINACAGGGIRVPEDVALIVADNDLPVCAQPPPSLTGIDLRYERAGYEAARLLDRLMRGKRAPADPVLVRPGGVHGRQSTDFFVSNDSVVVAAMGYITRHLQKPIGVADVAAATKTSRRTLERRFRDFAGRSVFAEIRRLRIERAKRLLLDTELPMKQVARGAGFRSSVQLYHVFRHFVGTTPSDFRAMPPAGR